MPPRRGLRFFAIGSTKIPLLTELKMMNAIPADDFTHDVFLSHSSKDKVTNYNPLRITTEMTCPTWT